ncbi:efflux RND transporter periplasmic adaptor subunit [Clostridium fungisolvens]|uniref:Efflux system component YknX n=1 Tax=Clostridium fungisolvens TaxID=1604897 RepID=A0A6V8SGK8_9CLOT|nr:efflux RND transporter periplasmic adaptor subunit [Clostridium fungisolvens]GFP75856.1 Putative efflux system component YknX [Clostridium fungisolvens]
MKKKVIAIVLVAVVVVGGLGYARSRKNTTHFLSVKTASVSTGDIQSYLSTTATIKSKNSKDYYPIQGKVKKVNVKVGDSVTKGQVLVEFDVTDPNISVKQAQINYDNAVLTKQMQVNANNDAKNNMADLDKQIADLNNQINEAKKNPQDVTKIQSLQQQQSTLQSKRDAAKIPYSDEQLKQADNTISLQKIALDTAKDNLSKSQSTIVADFDGVVTALNVAEGAATAAAAQPAITIQDVNNLKAVMSVGKFDAAKIQLGQEAVIKSGDKKLKGKVSFIGPSAKTTASATGTESTLPVEIDILDKPDGLKIDFDTDVDVLLGQVNNVIKVPAESLRTDKNDRNYLYVVSGGKAVEKEVKLGLQSDMEAQVTEGLSNGDKVILNPSSSVKDGVTVKEAGDGK